VVVKLVVLQGRDEGESFILRKQRTVLGRAPDADIRLENKGVSRRHCEIWLGPHGITLEDLSSRNGTYLNEALISTAPLYHGDRVTLGSVGLELNGLRYRNPQDTSAELVAQLNFEDDSEVSLESSRVVPFETVEIGERERFEAAFGAFLEVAHFLAQVADEGELIEGFVDRVRAQIEPDRVAFFVVGGAQGLMVPAKVWRSGQEDPGQLLEVSEGVVRQAIEGRTGVLVGVEQGEALRSVICVPLANGSGIAAVLYADRGPSRESFREVDLHRVSALTRLAASAMVRQRRVDELEARLQEANAALRSSEESRDELQALLQQAGEPLVLLDAEGRFVLGTGGAIALIEKRGESPDFPALYKEWSGAGAVPVPVAGDEGLAFSFQLLPDESGGEPSVVARILREKSSQSEPESGASGGLR